jgi:hypothetical protein
MGHEKGEEAYLLRILFFFPGDQPKDCPDSSPNGDVFIAEWRRIAC